MVLVIGGAINTSRPGIAEIIEQRDRTSLLAIARAQVAYGAGMLGVNCGTRIKTEHLWPG